MLKNLFQRFIAWLQDLKKEATPISAPIHSSQTNDELRATLQSLATSYKAPKSIIISWDAGDRPHEYNFEEFERLSSLHYLTHLEFQDLRTLKAVQKQCLYLCDKDCISTESKWLGSYYGEQLRVGYVNDIVIKWIGIEIGYGAFARRDIEAFEFIGEYTGVIKRRRFLFSKSNDYCFFYPSSYHCFIPYIIDSQEKGNITRFINHSETPNCESHSILVGDLLHIIIRATKKIPKGQQIVYDYGEKYWRHRKRLHSLTG